MSVLGGARSDVTSPWVAEVWVDPQWYACQSSPDRLPDPGPPTVVALRGSQILIGRHSESASVVPHIDCVRDGAVSRRHAQLTRCEEGWVVEDLGSANGTFVSSSVGEIPEDPIEASHTVGSGHVLYLGSWTRIVLKQDKVLEGP
ncbi:forkhead-associated protein [Knoellia sinensis KCTC 19936]|uniref:Forkhead-associated protein n=1 Tax=Knoellia sinensis KCTC 19936 TaxID=1385520 RepID=A0A0A0JAM6_9MICO|nr:FHA domain-containing protein [Knoellia sinensis]KGN34198.1 forkhead-associated protein [Knoellia sinensis KCTC 19936]